MNKRRLETILIPGSVLLWLINKFSYIISSYFSRLLCGELHLQPVDGILGDVSCRFNADMHFTALMFLVLITGIAVIIISLVQKDVH
jgi:hypothetical protein